MAGYLTGSALGQSTSPAPQTPEYLIGAYYFAGWWRESPNKWQVQGHDWRPEWPGRVPTLGEYNEPATMDREIVAAADHGVDFFQILYYCQKPGAPAERHADKLNVALDQFMASPHAGRMKFTLETVNHAPFDVPSEAEWAHACRIWALAMRHPSYLRIDGRPVFKIHGYDQFLKAASGKPDIARARLDQLRKAVRAAGAGEVMLSAGILPEDVRSGSLAGDFDFLTTYMWMPPLPKRDEPYPYARLIDYAESGWKLQSVKTARFYVPYVPAGWDPRPWKDPRCSFAAPTREQWTDALRRAKRALDTQPRLGVPMKDGGRQKMLLIYAWNEFGEGGIVAPTRGEGTLKLEAIREVFGAGQSAKTRRGE